MAKKINIEEDILEDDDDIIEDKDHTVEDEKDIIEDVKEPSKAQTIKEEITDNLKKEDDEEEGFKEFSEKSNPILKRLINKEPTLFSTDKNKFYTIYGRKKNCTEFWLIEQESKEILKLI